MGSGEAILYSEANFGGSEVWKGGGFSNIPGVTMYSLKLNGGSAKTWKGDNRTGEERCWSGSVPNLQDHSWQNAIQSIEVFSYDACPPANDVAILFDNTNYGGDKQAYGKGRHDIGGSTSNDRFESMTLPPEWSARLYEHGNYGGASECYPVISWATGEWRLLAQSVQ